MSVSQQSDLVIDTVSKVTAHCLVSAPVTHSKRGGVEGCTAPTLMVMMIPTLLLKALKKAAQAR